MRIEIGIFTAEQVREQLLGIWNEPNRPSIYFDDCVVTYTDHLTALSKSRMSADRGKINGSWMAHQLANPRYFIVVNAAEKGWNKRNACFGDLFIYSSRKIEVVFNPSDIRRWPDALEGDANALEFFDQEIQGDWSTHDFKRGITQMAADAVHIATTINRLFRNNVRQEIDPDTFNEHRFEAMNKALQITSLLQLFEYHFDL